LSHEPVGIVLFNLGGPATQAEVEPFLANLFSDREIIELPLGPAVQPLFAKLIAKVRGPSVRRNYRLIGGGSPQLRITRQQAAALSARLNAQRPVGRLAHVEIAMRYSRPDAAEALEAMAARGIRRLVTLTLFPHYSKATTGSSRAAFDRTLASPRWRRHGFEVTHIDRYPDDPAYLEAMADTIRRAWLAMPRQVRERAVILFSAHGLPQKFIDEGDPYVDQIEATRQGLLDLLRLPNRQVLAYQSRTGPVKWIGPGTEEAIRDLAAEGVKEILVVPLSFVGDHIETLYEVDILFKGEALRAGIVEYRRPEALNAHPLFIEALARQVEGHFSRDPMSDAAPAGVIS
jgi:ferrochelatase